MQRAPYHPIDSLPGTADAAGRLKVALAFTGGTIGDGDWAFECIQNRRRGNGTGRPRQAIAAMQTPR